MSENKTPTNITDSDIIEESVDEMSKTPLIDHNIGNKWYDGDHLNILDIIQRRDKENTQPK